MMLRNVLQRVTRWWLVTAVLITLIAAPTAPPVLAGDCVPSSSSSCTG
ncbi:MAG: hypothetical protein KF770_05310 [Anaerolineae bacterium]|nr:hypothetical protein [Anaerolineae bacterium]